MTAGQSMRHLQPRRPDGRRFCWARIPDRDGLGVTYRLFLRDITGKVFHQSHHFPLRSPRKYIAWVLRGLRVQIRWVVDQVDFQHLGMNDPTPQPQTSAQEAKPCKPGMLAGYRYRC